MVKFRTLLLCSALLGGFFILMTVNVKTADISKNFQNSVLTTDSCVINASYRLTDPTGEYNDTVKVKFYFNSGGRNVERIETKILVTSPGLTFIDTVTSGYYKPWTSATWSKTVIADTVKVTIAQITPPCVFNEDSLFALKVRLDCFTPGTAKDVNFTPGGCPNDFNFFEARHQTGFYIGPTFDNGTAGIFAYDATLFWDPVGGAVNVPIGDTGVIPIAFNTNFSANNGYEIKGTFDTSKLDFAGVVIAGTYSAGKMMFTSQNLDTFRIVTPSAIAKPPSFTYPHLIKVKFKNKATEDSIFHHIDFAVDLKSDTFFDAFSCPGALASGSIPFPRAYVNTPVYAADLSVKNMSITRATFGIIQIQLKNSFKVDMRIPTAVLETERATYRVNQAGITNITINPIGNSVVNFSEVGFQYRWIEESGPPGGSRIYKSGPTSDPILTHATPYTVSGIAFTSGNVDAIDTLDFLYTTDPFSGWFQKDSQLKGLNTNIVIRPDALLGDDHLKLISGTITVNGPPPPPPPPPSCPFLYVWNGANFEEDNSILTQTEYSAKEQTVTDYYLIQRPLVTKDNQYHLQLRELAEEKSFVDKIELLTVDHPQEQKIAVTSEGKIFYMGEEFSPVAVVDDKGQDQRDKVLTKDGILFTSQEKGHLILTYTVPDESRTEDFIVTGPNGPKPICEPNGRVSPNGNREPVLQLVKTEILDKYDRWVETGQNPPRDNYSEAHWLLDPTRIEVGETFQVRISWEKSYMADEVKFYTVSDQTPVVHPFSPASASHSNSSSVMKLLSAEDRQFATLVRGEKLDLLFPAENLPLAEGYTRSFIVKASGYYIPYASEPSASIPDRFELKENYPNPFNASTEISYSLPVESEVKLAIYNIRGQKVKTLVDGKQTAGVHKVTWDGKNDKGESVASGVYFYTIKAGSYIQTNKMTLLK